MEWAAGAAAAPAQAREDDAVPVPVRGIAGRGDDADEATDLARLILDVLDCQWSAVYLQDAASGLALAAAQGAVADRLPDARALVFLADPEIRPQGPQRLVCAPLRHDGVDVGLLVAGVGPGRSFTSRERQLLQGLARLAAAGVRRRALPPASATPPTGTEILATMSHELRTPLNAVVGYLDMLADDAASLTPEQRDILAAGRRSAIELQSLVSATLELARLDAGRARVQTADFPFDALLAEIAGEARPRSNAPVRLAWQVARGAVRLHTDRAKLKIVLKNLIGNALKFTEAGRVEVSARDEGDGLVVEVRDTGIGIPTDELPFIFERFRQGSRAGERGGGGVGLGLHIVQRLVDLLGGSVHVESEQGVGTAFTLRLPGTVCAGRHVA